MRHLIAFKSKIYLSLIIFTLASFFLLRIALLLSNIDYFSLSASQILFALIYGMRFDVAIITLLAAPFILASILPFKFAETLRWQALCAWLCCVALLIALTIGAADFAFFADMHRHITTETTQIGSDWPMLLDIAWQSRRPETLAYTIALILLVFAWHLFIIKKLPRGLTQTATHPQRWTSFFLILICCVFSIRGFMFNGKPISTADAYHAGPEAAAQLALNGAFSAIRSGFDKQNKVLNFVPQHSISDYSIVADVDPKHLFFKQFADNVPSQHNVIVFLLESWSQAYIDSLSNSNYGATPFFDSIVENSLVFEQAYAAAQRSIQGVQAVLTSIPVLPEQPALGDGLELISMPRIGYMSSAYGYHNIMVQSSNRRSFHLDAIANALGFDEYYGKQDIPLLKKYPQDIPRFGWDYDTLQFFKTRLDQAHRRNKPFFGFVFTGTTHEPFPNPGKEFLLYPHNPQTELGFLNTLRYADWSLEQFMLSAESEPWFNDTIFIFVADHTMRATHTADPRQLFRIPLVIYSPAHIAPKRDNRIASQYDILPTIIDLMGINTPFTAFGDSLLREDPHPEAWVLQGNLMGLIHPKGMLRHNERSPVDYYPSTSISDEHATQSFLEKRLQLIYQVASERISQNKWNYTRQSTHQTAP